MGFRPDGVDVSGEEHEAVSVILDNALSGGMVSTDQGSQKLEDDLVSLLETQAPSLGLKIEPRKHVRLFLEGRTDFS